MAFKSLATSGIVNFSKYQNALVGNAAFDPSSDFLIQEVVLSSATASVTFDVSTLASTYKHLQIRAAVRNSDTAYAGDFLKMRFNSDSASNYSQHQLNGNGSAVASVGYANTTEIYAGNIVTNAFTANVFAPVICDILDPFSTTKNKTTRSLSGFTGSTNRIYMDSGAWRNTAAVTSIVLSTSGALNFVSGSRFSLYGSKG